METCKVSTNHGKRCKKRAAEYGICGLHIALLNKERYYINITTTDPNSRVKERELIQKVYNLGFIYDGDETKDGGMYHRSLLFLTGNLSLVRGLREVLENYIGWRLESVYDSFTEVHI